MVLEALLHGEVAYETVIRKVWTFLSAVAHFGSFSQRPKAKKDKWNVSFTTFPWGGLQLLGDYRIFQFISCYRFFFFFLNQPCFFVYCFFVFPRCLLFPTGLWEMKLICDAIMVGDRCLNPLWTYLASSQLTEQYACIISKHLFIIFTQTKEKWYLQIKHISKALTHQPDDWHTK